MRSGVRVLAVILLAAQPWRGFSQVQHAANSTASSIVAEELVKSTNSWDGRPLPAYPQGKPEITIKRITIAPGARLETHIHPVINAGILTRGELTVFKTDGKTLQLKAGDPIVELVSSPHYGINQGTEPAEIVVFYAGAVGTPIAVYTSQETTKMINCNVDHIAVTARSLEEGADFVEKVLGVRPKPGGEHQRMGTHNLVLRLGDSTYLEVIAPNPNAPKPDRPRWFGLDDASAIEKPRLATWIARTTNIQETVSAIPEGLGTIEPMSRGTLNWLITIPQDGSLPMGGVAPALIEWHVPAHPASKMPESGCTLAGLELFHPEPDRLTALVKSLGLQHVIKVTGIGERSTPYVVANINTPGGPRKLAGNN